VIDGGAASRANCPPPTIQYPPSRSEAIDCANALAGWNLFSDVAASFPEKDVPFALGPNLLMANGEEAMLTASGHHLTHPKGNGRIRV
jgi:hypothetical protein